MIRYCPAPSVTAVRVFSIRAGLLASTVTPGTTAPVVSLTAPAITLWAATGRHVRTSASAALAKVVMIRRVGQLRIHDLLPDTWTSPGALLSSADEKGRLDQQFKEPTEKF